MMMSIMVEKLDHVLDTQNKGTDDEEGKEKRLTTTCLIEKTTLFSK